MAPAPKDPPFGFTFDKGPAASRLTITIPDMKSPGESMGLAKPDPAANPAEMQQELAMMKMVMRGMFIDVSLDLDGRIVKTDAPYVQGSRVTLMQIDFDKMLADETVLLKLQNAKDAKALAGVPGLKILTNPKVNIEFAK